MTIAMADTPIEQAKQELARILGAPDIRTETPRWLSLMQEGVVIHLHVRRWRARTRLDAADLGLARAADDLIGDLLNLGDKRLLPQDLARRVEAIESAGRKTLERHGYATFWGVFVPAANFAAWQAENATHRARYLLVRDEIVARYDAILDELTAAYRGAAHAAFRRARAFAAGDATRAELADERAIVERFLRRIRGLIPTPGEIFRSFAWDVEYTYIPLPSLLAEDLAARDRIEREREVARLEAELRRDELWQELAIRDEADRARRLALARMNDEVVAESRRKKEQLIDGFLTDLVVQLRTLVFEAASDVLATMARNDGGLHPRSIVQLKNLIAQVSRLNFFGDDETGQMIREVQAAFDRRGEDRAAGEIRDVLQDVAQLTRASLINLGATPRACRALADWPSGAPAGELAAARRRLNLDDSAGEPIPVELTPTMRRLLPAAV